MSRGQTKHICKILSGNSKYGADVEMSSSHDTNEVFGARGSKQNTINQPTPIFMRHCSPKCEKLYCGKLCWQAGVHDDQLESCP